MTTITQILSLRGLEDEVAAYLFNMLNPFIEKVERTLPPNIQIILYIAFDTRRMDHYFHRNKGPLVSTYGEAMVSNGYFVIKQYIEYAKKFLGNMATYRRIVSDKPSANTRRPSEIVRAVRENMMLVAMVRAYNDFVKSLNRFYENRRYMRFDEMLAAASGLHGANRVFQQMSIQ